MLNFLWHSFLLTLILEFHKNRVSYQRKIGLLNLNLLVLLLCYFLLLGILPFLLCYLVVLGILPFLLCYLVLLGILPFLLCYFLLLGILLFLVFCCSGVPYFHPLIFLAPFHLLTFLHHLFEHLYHLFPYLLYLYLVYSLYILLIIYFYL